MSAKVDEERCIGCETCVEECPIETIEMADGTARVDPDLCTDCGTCIDVCPVEAISME